MEVTDNETQNQVREQLAYLVRSAGIELYNTKNDSLNAERVLISVKIQFSDLPNVREKIEKDLDALKTQIRYKMIAEASRKEREKKGKIKGIIWGVIAVAIVICLIVGSKPSRPYSSPSRPSYSSSPSTTQRPVSTAKPTSTPKPQSMPANGKVFYCSTTDRPSSFKVTNNGSSNYYMKFVEAGTNTTVITFFVRANSTVEIQMPAGYFELRYASGSTWYGESKLFGDYTRYAKDEEYYDFSRYTWEITIKSNGNAGETMDVEEISADEF